MNPTFVTAKPRIVIPKWHRSDCLATPESWDVKTTTLQLCNANPVVAVQRLHGHRCTSSHVAGGHTSLVLPSQRKPTPPAAAGPNSSSPSTFLTSLFASSAAVALLLRLKRQRPACRPQVHALCRRRSLTFRGGRELRPIIPKDDLQAVSEARLRVVGRGQATEEGVAEVTIPVGLVHFTLHHPW